MSSHHHLSVAPMMDWTDRHCRYFLRLISRHTLLYTEMVTADAIIHGDRDYHLGFDDAEHPVALQLGGSDPSKLAECCRIAEDYGYDEVNLNVGCPSDRVQQGRFGLCLMAEPQLVAECIDTMQQATSLPVTVKTRIGVDHQDSYEALSRFINIVSDTGCHHFIIHARKGWLKGLSPKENRTIPPLQYDMVYRLKQDYPNHTIVINGGIETLQDAVSHLKHVDGAMLGRAAYHNPYLLAEADSAIFADNHPIPNRKAILEQLIPYAESQLKQGAKLHYITRHILGLYHGQPHARAWRRYFTQAAQTQPNDIEVLRYALREF